LLDQNPTRNNNNNKGKKRKRSGKPSYSPSPKQTSSPFNQQHSSRKMEKKENVQKTSL
jgi:hypothetical protein